jgi:D-arabinose 1-dehydrogenase-like Zn-dependent alcohol dehydrogenase
VAVRYLCGKRKRRLRDTAMKMRAMVIQEQGGDFVLEEREVPEPGHGEALVKVHACGVCHSDVFAKEGGFPGVSYPVIPGHEIAGEIAALGGGVHGWAVGQRVGVGWFGGNCGWCEPCRRGQLIDCENMGIPGVTFDGGYAEYCVVRSSALAAMPDELSPEDAGPLLCAGVTTFNALRTSDTPAGGRVAILGIGGLGHLAVQFAVRLGYETIAVARGADKAQLAEKLGAHHYIDSTDGDPAEKLQALGGVDLILATATSADAMGALFGGLRPQGKLLIVGASMDPVPVPPAALIGGDKIIEGHASGTSIDSEDTLHFSVLSEVRPMIETVGLEQAGEAYAKMMSGDARFRMVLQVAS